MYSSLLYLRLMLEFNKVFLGTSSTSRYQDTFREVNDLFENYKVKNSLVKPDG